MLTFLKVRHSVMHISTKSRTRTSLQIVRITCIWSFEDNVHVTALIPSFHLVNKTAPWYFESAKLAGDCMSLTG